MLSNTIGCVGCGASSEEIREDGVTGLLAGCFSRRMSCTLLVMLLVVITLSSGRGALLESEVRKRTADFTLPSIIRFANVRASLLLVALLHVLRRCWMVSPS